MAISLFDVNTYRAANPDLAAAGLTTDAQLSQHYQSGGVNEGRIGSLFANLNVYRSSNPDLAAAGLTSNRQLLDHLQGGGVAEGRRFSQYVDIDFYLRVNGDVNQAFGGNREQALEHLRSVGVNEGRAFSPFLNVGYYLNANSDVNQAVSGNQLRALEHLELSGINESRSFSPFVDVSYYLATNPDLNQAFSGNRAKAFEHLVSRGVEEGRSFSPAFNVNAYRDANVDLAGGGVNTNRKLFEHWVATGAFEGRTAIADPGNTLGTALNLGSPDPGGTYFHNAIGGTDTDDYYSFTLTSPRDVFAELYGLSADLDIALLNSSGSYIQGSFAEGNADDGVAFYSLGAGTYYAQVLQGVSNVSSSYDLNLSFLNPVDPGSTISTADVLTDVIPAAEFVIQGIVGGSDLSDFYAFNLLSNAVFSAVLEPLSADANLFLYNAGGSLIASSAIGGTNIDSFFLSLSAGTYYVEARGASSSTEYTLELIAS